MTLSRLLSPPSDPSSILVRGGDVGGRSDVTPPAEVAARLNRLFPFDPATEQFATLVYGVLDAATGEFRYVSAGHPGPVHLPAGGDPVILESQGFPIGLAADAYEERSVRLGAGDRLYLYSDGVPEAMDPAGEQFGDARLLEAIGRGRSEPLQEGTNALLGEIARWHGSERPQDDISILAVEVSAASGPGRARHRIPRESDLPSQTTMSRFPDSRRSRGGGISFSARAATGTMTGTLPAADHLGLPRLASPQERA